MRSRHVPRRRLPGLLLVLAAWGGAYGQTLHAPQGQATGLPAGQQLPPGTRVLAAGLGGLIAAATVVGEPRREVTTLTLLGGSAATRSAELEGETRALLFDPDGSALWAVQVEKRKHLELAMLMILDVATLEVRRSIRVSPTTRALAYWPERRALVLGCTDELRTMMLPALRTGPLFRVAGENRALAWLGGSEVLVGQTDALVRLDLSLAPDPDWIPPIDQLALPASAVALGLSADGESGLLETADGRVLDFRTSPLRLGEQRGTGRVPGGLVPAARRGIAAPRDTSRPVVPRPEAAPEIPPPAPAPRRVAPTEASPAEAQREPEVVPEVVANPPERGDTPAHEIRPGVHGRIEGPAAGEVAAVVISGPDNVLAVAARVEPGADGTWRSPDLQPGRYRIQAVGLKGRALSVQPHFVMLDVGEPGEERTPIVFHVLATR